MKPFQYATVSSWFDGCGDLIFRYDRCVQVMDYALQHLLPTYVPTYLPHLATLIITQFNFFFDSSCLHNYVVNSVETKNRHEVSLADLFPRNNRRPCCRRVEM